MQEQLEELIQTDPDYWFLRDSTSGYRLYWHRVNGSIIYQDTITRAFVIIPNSGLYDLGKICTSVYISQLEKELREIKEPKTISE